MPLMSFSIAEQIPLLLDGRKQQTTRFKRKNPIEVGDILYCYYKPRQKSSCRNCITVCKYSYERRQHFGYSSMPTALKPCNIYKNYFGEAEVIHVRSLSLYNSLWEKWAIADGFESLSDAVNWFARTYNKSLQELMSYMEVISFSPKWLK